MNKPSLLILATLIMSTAFGSSTNCYKRVYGESHFTTKSGQAKNLEQAFDKVYLRVTTFVDENTKDKPYYEENGPNKWVQHRVEMAVSANTRKTGINQPGYFQFDATANTEDDLSQDQTYCVINEHTQYDEERVFGCIKLHTLSEKGRPWKGSVQNKYMSIVRNKNFVEQTSGADTVIDINIFRAIKADWSSFIEAEVSSANGHYGLNKVSCNVVDGLIKEMVNMN